MRSEGEEEGGRNDVNGHYSGGHEGSGRSGGRGRAGQGPMEK